MFDFKITSKFTILALACAATVAILNLKSANRTGPNVALDQSAASGGAARLQADGIESDPGLVKLKSDQQAIARREAEQLELTNSYDADGEFAVQQASHQFSVEWASQPEKPITIEIQQPIVQRPSIEQSSVEPPPQLPQQEVDVSELTRLPEFPAETATTSKQVGYLAINQDALESMPSRESWDLPPPADDEFVRSLAIHDRPQERYPLVQQTGGTAEHEATLSLNAPTQGELSNEFQAMHGLAEPSSDFATRNNPGSSQFEVIANEAIANKDQTEENLAVEGLTNEPSEQITRVADSSSAAVKSKPAFQTSNAREDNDFRVAAASSSTATKAATKSPEPTSKAKAAKAKAKTKDKTPRSLIGADNYVLAGQPEIGDHWKDDTPLIDQRAMQIETSPHNFSPDPIDSYAPYDPYAQMEVYEGKTLNSNQRPLVELGRPWYQLGQLSPGYSWFGKHNNITPQFLVYGDVRTAVASNTVNGDNVSQVAGEINLDFDLKLTGTERLHMFWSPIDGNGKNTRYLLDENEYIHEVDADIDFGYFEGDLGAMVGGLTNKTLPFDLPFAVGVIPMLVQNGVWMEDAFLGVAATIPARNSPRFSISNMDVTFFAGYDKVTSDAFPGDDSAARMYGMLSFIEAMNGYFEIDYAFLDDRTFDDRSYHNIGIGFTRRYGRLVSNSTRVIVNAGQDSQVENTADGVLLLSENSLITSAPSTFVPYANFFAGFDRPQSAARAAASGGVLRNTGILFESDGMTGYPTLDPTANDTFGGAFGLNIIADDFSQQLVLETAFVSTMGEDATRNAPGNQYGVGFRYQLPLTNAIIFRTDGMYGFMDGQDDVRGLRFELRHKY